MRKFVQTGLAASGNAARVHPRPQRSNHWDGSAWPWTVAILLVLLFMCCSSNCEGQSAGCKQGLAFAVALDTAFPEANKPVEFTVNERDSIPHSAIPSTAQLINVPMNDGSYQVEFDRQSMAPVGDSARFTLYVNCRPHFTTAAYEYVVSEDAYDSFNDTIRNVNIRVGANGTDAVHSNVMGTAQLPLHSRYGPSPGLVDQSEQTVHSLTMGSGAQSFSIRLGSALDRLGATLGEPAASVTCGTCLQQVPPPKLSKTQLLPGDHVDVTVTVTPNVVQAMRASAGPTSEKYDADLNLSIPMTASDGGFPGTQSIIVHIKFSPPWPLTVLSVFFGGLLGAFIRIFVPSAQSNRREFILGLIYAWVSWLFAFLLFANGQTVIKLMGITFDPTQMVSAFALCVLTGGGPPLVKILQDTVMEKIGVRDKKIAGHDQKVEGDSQ